jgi:acyl carrier protein
MVDNTQLKQQVKELIVESLNLEDVDPTSIEDEQPLFGTGLELDSLDALQLAVAIEERFGVPITDSDMGEKVFASVVTLARFIDEARTDG